jgi:hypothetical protein
MERERWLGGWEVAGKSRRARGRAFGLGAKGGRESRRAGRRQRHRGSGHFGRRPGQLVVSADSDDRTPFVACRHDLDLDDGDLDDLGDDGC